MYARMVAGFNASRLSPGGSADLCAASLFLADLEAIRTRRRSTFAGTVGLLA